MKNKCIRCGTMNKREANFCRACGEPFLDKIDFGTLVNAAMEGEQDAITCLFHITNRKYWLICKNILWKRFSSDEIEDVLQDSYIKIFKSLSQLKEPDKFIAWGAVIVRNTAINYYNRTKPLVTREETLEQVKIEDYEPEKKQNFTELNPEQILDKKETAYLIDKMIEQLPEEQRICIFLYYIEERSVKEIAMELGVSENTVKSRLKYGRAKIEEQVLLLEKKGTKLYNLAPFTFFLWLYKCFLTQEEAHITVSASVRARVVEQVRQNTGKQGAMKNEAKKFVYKESKSKIEDISANWEKIITKTTEAIKFLIKKYGIGKVGIVIIVSIIAVNSTVFVKKEGSIHSEKMKETQAMKLYRNFYEAYIAEENLEVFTGHQSVKSSESTDCVQLLMADVDDFIGDGEEKLLMIRTAIVEEPELDWWRIDLIAELYEIEKNEVVLVGKGTLDKYFLGFANAGIDIYWNKMDGKNYLLCDGWGTGASVGGTSYSVTCILMEEDKLEVCFSDSSHINSGDMKKLRKAAKKYGYKIEGECFNLIPPSNAKKLLECGCTFRFGSDTEGSSKTEEVDSINCFLE